MVETPPAPPRIAVRIALALRAKLLRLADRVVPAQAVIVDQAFGFVRTKLLAEAARLKIADRLGDGPKSAAELARLSGVDADMLHRTLRACASFGIFEIDQEGRFRQNRLSEALKSGAPASMRAWAVHCGQASNYAAWGDFDRTLETGRHAWSRVHGKDMWTYFAEHPDEGSVFAQCMSDLTDLQAPMIAEAYPFSDFRVLCDVAGGRGQLLATILQRHAGPRGWLVDAPQVLDGAAGLLRARGVIDRVELKPADMFKEIPAGADAYVLKDILHDWDDERSNIILSTCRRAMAPGKKLLLVEMVLEKTDAEPPGPLVDVHMGVVCCEGRQRSLAEFRRLFDRSGFKLSRVLPTAALSSIIEAVVV